MKELKDMGLLGIWQTQANQKTAFDAINEFAKSYWDKPRIPRNHTTVNDSRSIHDTLFGVRGGPNVYCCRYEPDDMVFRVYLVENHGLVDNLKKLGYGQ